MSTDLPTTGTDDSISAWFDRVDALGDRDDTAAESILPAMEERDADDDAPDPNRPALIALHQTQQEVLEEFTTEGVADRGSLLWWLLKLQYRTLGRLPDLWYHRMASNRNALAVATDGAAGNQSITTDEAHRARRRLVARWLRPAFRDAYRELRTSATEYLDNQSPEPDKMAALAMRPALDEHYQYQRASLEALLEGFDDLDALQGWLHNLDRDTFGAIKAVEQAFDYRLLTSSVARRACTGEAERYRTARERIAARFFLPATNVSVRVIAEKAGEDDHTSPDPTEGVSL